MGRPKGSKNKSTLAKEAAAHKAEPQVKGRIAYIKCGHCLTGHHDEHKARTNYSMGVVKTSICTCC